MAPPPSEIQKAEESLVGSDTTFTLVPSKQALADAAELKIGLSSSDFPLFVADRLAFASPNGGLQVRCLLWLNIVVVRRCLMTLALTIGSSFSRKARLPYKLQSPSRHQSQPAGDTEHSVDNSQ